MKLSCNNTNWNGIQSKEYWCKKFKLFMYTKKKMIMAVIVTRWWWSHEALCFLNNYNYNFQEQHKEDLTKKVDTFPLVSRMWNHRQETKWKRRHIQSSIRASCMSVLYSISKWDCGSLIKRWHRSIFISKNPTGIRPPSVSGRVFLFFFKFMIVWPCSSMVEQIDLDE